MILDSADVEQLASLILDDSGNALVSLGLQAGGERAFAVFGAKDDAIGQAREYWS
jgi:hypothetical protein